MVAADEYDFPQLRNNLLDMLDRVARGEHTYIKADIENALDRIYQAGWRDAMGEVGRRMDALDQAASVAEQGEDGSVTVLRARVFEQYLTEPNVPEGHSVHTAENPMASDVLFARDEGDESGDSAPE